MPDNKQGMRGLQIYKNKAGLSSPAITLPQALHSLPIDIFEITGVCTAPALSIRMTGLTANGCEACHCP